jgi:hypothetical protein
MISGLVSLIGMLIGIAISLAGFVFWLWMLIHAITNKGLSDGEKIAWVLAVILLPVIGCILYFFIGRPKGTAAVA